ncbi:hypothetical protein BH24CHL9_BH24CHL9_11560 [soil metagenome]
MLAARHEQPVIELIRELVEAVEAGSGWLVSQAARSATSPPADGSSGKTQSGASIVMATGRAQTETWSFHRPRS